MVGAPIADVSQEETKRFVGGFLFAAEAEQQPELLPDGVSSTTITPLGGIGLTSGFGHFPDGELTLQLESRMMDYTELE